MKSLLFFLSVVMSPALYSQNDPFFVGATSGGAAQEVEAYDNYLFVGNGSTFSVFYTGDNSMPPYEKTFEYRFKSRVQDLKVNNNFLYIASNHEGISKWDLSNPAAPELLYAYEPDSLREAAFDVEILNNDTVIVAYGNKIALFYDNGNAFLPLHQFAFTHSDGVLCGGALKDTLYACVKGMGNLSGRGVFIYDTRTFRLISYYHQDKADPEDLVFGQGTDLLHVFGGTYSVNNPFNPNGYFYSLDISDVYNPTLKAEFDIPGAFGGAVADAINGINENDTIYVATTAGLKTAFDFDSCYVYVYDATNPENIHPISKIFAGLWHFDVCKQNNSLFIASEWYGVKTVDLNNFYNPVDNGNTPTGGWNTGCDLYNNRLVVANEGYGFAEYDITDPFNIIKTGENHNGTFCHVVKYSNDGQYIFAFYSTDTGLIAYNAQTLSYAGCVNRTSLGDKQAYVNGNILISLQTELLSNNKKIYFFDVSDVNHIQMIDSLEDVVNDIKVYQNKLFVSSDDAISIYDISTGHPMLSASYTLNVLNDAGVFDVFNDTIYCYISGIGAEKIGRFVYDDTNNTIVFDNYFPTLTEKPEPKKIAADQQFVYLAYNLYGVRKYDRQTLDYLSYYKSGLDYKEQQQLYGVTGLFCKNNFILLSEYFGQTSLLSTDTSLLNLSDMQKGPSFSVYPNPAKDYITVSTENPPLQINLYSSNGVILGEYRSNEDRLTIDVSGFAEGVYFLKAYCGHQNKFATKKLVLY